jgi:hypothetical protein
MDLSLSHSDFWTALVQNLGQEREPEAWPGDLYGMGMSGCRGFGGTEQARGLCCSEEARWGSYCIIRRLSYDVRKRAIIYYSTFDKLACRSMF